MLVEIKAVNQIMAVHRAQLISYLRMGRMPVGLLINFNVASLKNGITRLVN